jgi:hypothetical protein
MPALRAPDVPTVTLSAGAGGVRGAAGAGVPARADIGAGVGVAAGAGAMICVGGSVAVSSVLAKAPVFTAEALRYAMACLILLLLARLTGRGPKMPRGTECCGCAVSRRPAWCCSTWRW